MLRGRLFEVRFCPAPIEGAEEITDPAEITNWIRFFEREIKRTEIALGRVKPGDKTERERLLEVLRMLREQAHADDRQRLFRREIA